MTGQETAADPLVLVGKLRDAITEREQLTREATPGPWFYNSYSGIFSSPRTQQYIAAEQLIPDDAPDDDPRWGALPETSVAWVPVRAGDTATHQGCRDAKFIEANGPDVVLARCAADRVIIDGYEQTLLNHVAPPGTQCWCGWMPVESCLDRTDALAGLRALASVYGIGDE